jgi:hypothetical protein
LAGPFAAVARIVCDGEGSCHGEGTQSLNGTLLPFVDQGTTYTVQSASQHPLHWWGVKPTLSSMSHRQCTF